MTARPLCLQVIPRREPAARRLPCTSVGVLLLAFLPVLALPEEPEPALVAEAVFLADPLPPGGNEVAAILVAEPEPGFDGPADGFAHAQLAFRPTPRVGATVELGWRVGSEPGFDGPAAALKLVLRDPAGGALGVVGSVDAVASVRALGETEAGLGLGFIRAVRVATLRASARLSSQVGSWAPRLHGGISAATAVGARVRLLGELIAETDGGETTFAAGPTVKISLDDRTSLTGAALVELREPLEATFLLQLTRGL